VIIVSSKRKPPEFIRGLGDNYKLNLFWHLRIDFSAIAVGKLKLLPGLYQPHLVVIANIFLPLANASSHFHETWLGLWSRTVLRKLMAY
jgi:hypothetical protein